MVRQIWSSSGKNCTINHDNSFTYQCCLCRRQIPAYRPRSSEALLLAPRFRQWTPRFSRWTWFFLSTEKWKSRNTTVHTAYTIQDKTVVSDVQSCTFYVVSSVKESIYCQGCRKEPIEHFRAFESLPEAFGMTRSGYRSVRKRLLTSVVFPNPDSPEIRLEEGQTLIKQTFLQHSWEREVKTHNYTKEVKWEQLVRTLSKGNKSKRRAVATIACCNPLWVTTYNVRSLRRGCKRSWWFEEHYPQAKVCLC